MFLWNQGWQKTISYCFLKREFWLKSAQNCRLPPRFSQRVNSVVLLDLLVLKLSHLRSIRLRFLHRFIYFPLFLGRLFVLCKKCFVSLNHSVFSPILFSQQTSVLSKRLSYFKHSVNPIHETLSFFENPDNSNQTVFLSQSSVTFLSSISRTNFHFSWPS